MQTDHHTPTHTPLTQAIYYLFFTRPNPFLAALDFYFLRPLADNTANKWSSSNFVLREKLGGGNFGAAFEGVRLEVGGLSLFLFLFLILFFVCFEAEILCTQHPHIHIHMHKHKKSVGLNCYSNTPKCSQKGDGRTISSRGQLTSEQKKRRVVLKRVARDGTATRCVLCCAVCLRAWRNKQRVVLQGG